MKKVSFSLKGAVLAQRDWKFVLAVAKVAENLLNSNHIIIDRWHVKHGKIPFGNSSQ